MKRRDFVLATVKAATALPVAAALPETALLGATTLVDGAVRHAADLRRWYRHLPGGALMPVADAHRALLAGLAGKAGGDVRTALLAALGEVELLLGWIAAFDLGDHRAAARRFTGALTAAEQAADRPLAALTLAAMAELTRHLGRLRAAAEQGARATGLLAGIGAPPTIGAFVHVVASATYAKAGERQPAARALDQARDELGRFTAEDVDGWRGIGMWNQTRFAEYEGSALLKAGQPEEAERAILRGLDQLAPTDAKYRALYLANLAHARVRQGHLDAGCDTATQAIRLAAEAGHALSLDVVWTILDELGEHRTHPAVVGVKDQLLAAARRQG